MKALRVLLALVAGLFLSPTAFSQGMCYLGDDGPRIIYDDALEPGWDIWAWGSTTTTQSYIAGKSGIAARQITVGSSNGGIQIQTIGTGDVYTNGHKALTFMLRRETSTPVYVSVVNDANVVGTSVIAGSPYVLPHTNVSSNVYGMWQIITIPLTVLQANNIKLGGIIFTMPAPGTFYLDKIELTDGFLNFPLDCSAPMVGGNCPSGSIDYRVAGAYTANSVTSVLDHSMKVNPSGAYPYGLHTTSPMGLDGVVLTWTGEKGESTASFPTVKLGCYPKAVGGSFSIFGTYFGTPDDNPACPTTRLNYDDHPGYDYRADFGTPVKAVASGIVVNANNNQRCIIGNLGDTCDDWGAVGIDHGNGYVTQYLHMKTSTIAVSPGQVVSQGDVIGYVDKTGLAPTAGPHLHFEVLKKVPGLTPGTYVYKMLDPYGWYTDGLDDPLTAIGAPSFLLWKP